MIDSTATIFPDRPVDYAGFWQRFLAMIVDGLLVGVIVFLVRIMGDGSFYNPTIWNHLFELIFGWLYYSLQESGLRQATFGKRALNIKVTNLDGGRISFGQATGRHFGKYLSTIIILIGYLMMLWDSKKQTLHDKMAGTLVIKDRPAH